MSEIGRILFSPFYALRDNIINFGMELLIYSQTLTAQPLKFANGEEIWYHTFLVMWFLIFAGIKDYLC